MPTSGHPHLWCSFCKKKPETEAKAHTLNQLCSQEARPCGGPLGAAWAQLVVSHAYNTHLARKRSQQGAGMWSESPPNPGQFSGGFCQYRCQYGHKAHENWLGSSGELAPAMGDFKCAVWAQYRVPHGVARSLQESTLSRGCTYCPGPL